MSARLTAKQENFSIAVAKGMNASDAYRSAYDVKNSTAKSVHELASHLLANIKVASRIDELRAPAIAASGLSIERTLREVSRLAYFDPRKLYRADGTVKRPDEWDDDTAAAVGGVDVVESFETVEAEDGDGTTRVPVHTKKYKIWDKNAALEKAMKHLGLFEKDNAQISKPVAIQLVFE